jgi:hypothetical protein
VPASQHGTHTITASDGTTSTDIPLTIEAVPPTSPSPLSPETGAEVNKPISFEWGNVIDVSTPVTYELQVATSKNFASGTVVVSQTGISVPLYTLSEAEELILSSAELTYYWRVRAIDAALNVSDWTPGISFTLAVPFSFVGWPLYTTVIVGAILIFLIGYWLGRRTAFSF